MTAEFGDPPLVPSPALPPGVGVGPGSQPAEEDGQTLDYMEMPREMAVFAPPAAPEPEDVVGMEAGKARLHAICDGLRRWRPGEAAITVDLAGLAPTDLGLVNQILGEGEVSIVSGPVQAQESVFAGAWRVLQVDEAGALISDVVEIGAWPASVAARVFAAARADVAQARPPLPESVFNAPGLLTEIDEATAQCAPDRPAHSINLSLLPHTEQDLVYLDEKLGRGDTIILSRGYGNCRIAATGTRNVWWVRYYNSQDAIVLNSIEVTPAPSVIHAAPEDIADSAERLREVLEIYA